MKKRTKFLFIHIIALNALLSFTSSCKKEDKSQVPILTTTTVTNITETTATSGGNISSDGGENMILRGICWNTSKSPTIQDNKTSEGNETGEFTSNITGLAGGTIYYVRAYATNSIGTAYGNEITFTTITAIPTLTTDTVLKASETTALSGGNITLDGGSPIISRGVCWNTSKNPTIQDNKTLDGSGLGRFTSSITGLTFGLTYYVRAYATNSVGTAYGAEIKYNTLVVGDSYQGGKIGYILKPTDAGYIDGEIHGIIVSPTDLSTGAIWGCEGTVINVNSSNGQQNTIKILATCSTPGIAARLCGDLVLGGYSDWYLPSMGELHKIFLNNSVIGVSVNNPYWSSSEYYNFPGIFALAFIYGSDEYINKTSTCYVRAVRSF
jgi:hypothetical protein